MLRDYLVEYAFSLGRAEFFIYLALAFILGWTTRALYKRSWWRRFWRYHFLPSAGVPYRSNTYLEYIPGMIMPPQQIAPRVAPGYVPYYKNNNYAAAPYVQVPQAPVIVPAPVVVPQEPMLKKEVWDDLTVIEGIGPKIASVLSNAGVSTFRKLTDAPLKEVSAILENSGISPELHNPATWASQAYLALNQKWDELKVLQNELVRGVHKDI